MPQELYDEPADEGSLPGEARSDGARSGAYRLYRSRPASLLWKPTGEYCHQPWNAAEDNAERREILATYGIKVNFRIRTTAPIRNG